MKFSSLLMQLIQEQQEMGRRLRSLDEKTDEYGNLYQDVRMLSEYIEKRMDQEIIEQEYYGK